VGGTSPLAILSTAAFIPARLCNGTWECGDIAPYRQSAGPGKRAGCRNIGEIDAVWFRVLLAIEDHDRQFVRLEIEALKQFITA
jgi:hypothetical protein